MINTELPIACAMQSVNPTSDPAVHVQETRLYHVATDKYFTVKDGKPCFRRLKSCDEG